MKLSSLFAGGLGLLSSQLVSSSHYIVKYKNPTLFHAACETFKDDARLVKHITGQMIQVMNFATADDADEFAARADVHSVDVGKCRKERIRCH
jgi:hypothetical protein